jgi:uncharacterized lipoprotein YmbA
MRSRQDLESRQLSPSRDVALGNVVIASYIDQPGLVVETADGEIRAAQRHQWAEPIYDAIYNQLSVEISRAWGEDLLPRELVHAPVVLDIRVDQLHGTNGGTARLVAHWWLRRDGALVSAHQFAEEQALATDGYSALVAAEETLLTRLAQQIAASLPAVVSD